MGVYLTSTLISFLLIFIRILVPYRMRGGQGTSAGEMVLQSAVPAYWYGKRSAGGC